MEEEIQPQRAPLRRPVMQYIEQEAPKERISKITGSLIIITAFSIDAFEMLLEWLGIGILGLSTLLSICASLGFWIWFKMLGVSFGASPKKFLTMGGTSFLEIIPGLDALGGFIWTIGIIALVVITRSEDKGGLLGKAASAARAKMK